MLSSYKHISDGVKNKAETFGFKAKKAKDVESFIKALNSNASVAVALSDGHRQYASVTDIFNWLRIDIDGSMKEYKKTLKKLKKFYYIDLPSTNFNPNDDKKNFKRHIYVKTKNISQRIAGYKEQMAEIVERLGLEFIKDKSSIKSCVLNMNPYKNGKDVELGRQYTTIHDGKAIKLMKVDDSVYPSNASYATNKVGNLNGLKIEGKIQKPMIIREGKNVIEMDADSLVSSEGGFLTIGEITDMLMASEEDEAIYDQLGCVYHNKEHSQGEHQTGYGFASLDDDTVYFHCKGACCESKKPVVSVKKKGSLPTLEIDAYTTNGSSSLKTEKGLTVPEPIEPQVLEDIEGMIAEGKDVEEVLRAVAEYPNLVDRARFQDIAKVAFKMSIVDIRKIVNEFRRDRLETFKPAFPDYVFNQEMQEVRYLNTQENMKVLLDKKIKLNTHYDVIKKEVMVKGWDKKENWKAGLRSHVISEALKEDLPRSIVEDQYDVAIRGEPANPLLDIVKATKWDGKNHIKKLAKRLKVEKKSEKYRNMILMRWLIQCVASWDACENSGNKFALPKYEYIFTLGGEQGANKTSFFTKLMHGGMNSYFNSGSLLKPNDRDSIKQNTSYGMNELGELDATVRKSDISEIKAFLSKMFDEYRVSYGREDERHLRRTSFCASVNPLYFLNDITGNRRFLYIRLIGEIDVEGINFKQVWSQAWALYLEGERWWIEGQEQVEQSKANREATDFGVVGDTLTELKNEFYTEDDVKYKWYSTTKVWEKLKGKTPTKAERITFLEITITRGDFQASQHNGIRLPEKLFESYL